MKKVTKMKLSEMANKMSVLTVEEQTEYIGGAVYFDENGSYLGQLGNSVEMRIVNYSTFHSLSGCNDDSELWPHSNLFNMNTSNSMKEAILNSMAKEIGISGGIQMGYLGADRNGECNSAGVITMNYNAPNFKTGNYYDFLLSLSHEKYHRDTWGSYESDNEAEFWAYDYIYRSLEYQVASQNYQAGVYEQYIRFAQYVNFN